jgi:hypothetical protein
VEKRHRLGTYGVGRLWGFRDEESLLVLFNDTPIAKRLLRPNTPWRREWTPLHSDWADMILK